MPTFLLSKAQVSRKLKNSRKLKFLHQIVLKNMQYKPNTTRELQSNNTNNATHTHGYH
jgi:hypothetical protein